MRVPKKVKLLFDYYLGEAKCNGSEAARLSGYKLPNKAAYRICKKLAKYLQDRQLESEQKAILSGTEIDILLSDIAKNPDHRDQVRALELLAKMKGKLSEKVTLDRDSLVKDLDSAIDKLLQNKALVQSGEIPPKSFPLN